MQQYFDYIGRTAMVLHIFCFSYWNLFIALTTTVQHARLELALSVQRCWDGQTGQVGMEIMEGTQFC